jgi:peptide chain release factor 3
LKNEYGVELRMQQLPYRYARWIGNEGLDPRKLNLPSTTMIVEDKVVRHVILFENEWSIRMAEERNKELRLFEVATAEFGVK